MAKQTENIQKFFNREIQNIFISLKIVILFFCIIPVIQRVLSFNTSGEVFDYNILKMVSFLIIISVITLFWFVINYSFKNKRLRAFIEIAVMYVICLLCYISTGSADSSYKFMFTLIVIVYSMEMGVKEGMVLSVLSGLSILIGDYFTAPKQGLSDYFQADFLLIATFCLVAYIVGFYVEKDKSLINDLKESVNKDALTGLYNHRYFHECLKDAITDDSKKYFLFIADIDNFKVYNDTLGHIKGDAVLKNISKLSNEVITDGLIFRYGGEEFAVVITAKDTKEACNVAESLRQHISDYHFEGQELMPGHNLTISLGIAEKRGSNDTVSDWIERADNALYKAKFFRKNRVELYTSVFERFDHLDQIDDDERIISIKTLLSVINSRDRYTYNHTDRVVHYCEIYSKYVKLNEKDSKTLLYSAYLHDIGKINVAKEILISEKKLTDQQWEEMKKHPYDGAEIVKKIKNLDGVSEIVVQHHEKYDGSGYPYGAKGDELHPLSRILTLADSFDAMTAKRPYQKVKTFEEAFAEIRRCKGTQFDPEIAEVFISALEEVYFR